MLLTVERRAQGQSESRLLSAARSSWVSYGLYLLIAGVFWQAYAFRNGPDMISYLSIANEYFAGHWRDAINTFWSPLISWLVAVGMTTHIPPYPLMRVLVTLSGLVGLAAIRRLALRLGLREEMCAGVTLIAAIMLSSYAMLVPGPDFISICLLILYLNCICTDGPDRRRNWLLAGVIGALLYLTKAYMFSFVIAHLIVSTTFRLWSPIERSARRKVLTNCLGAICCLLIVSGPWLVVISLTAGHPLLSAAGGWNYAKAQMDPHWFPHLTRGLFPPANPSAVSVWEDPGRMPLPPWNPLSSAKSAQRQIDVAARNVLYFVYFAVRASVLSIVIVPVFAWMTLRRIPKEQLNSWRCLLAAYAIYPLGYILISLGEERYIWIENVLLLLMGACIADFIWTHRAGARWLVASIIAAGLSFWCEPFATLIYHWGQRHDLHLVAESLRDMKLSGNVASNGQWEESLYLCYDLGLQYYGIPKNERPADVERDLQEYKIKYLFFWNHPSVAVPVDSRRELRATRDLRIYLLRTAGP